jgi:hypothetical protein
LNTTEKEAWNFNFTPWIMEQEEEEEEEWPFHPEGNPPPMSF